MEKNVDCQPCNSYLSGFTLVDARGPRRIGMLEDAKLTLQLRALQIQDEISIIEHELKQIAESERRIRDLQTPIADFMIPAGWNRGL